MLRTLSLLIIALAAWLILTSSDQLREFFKQPAADLEIVSNNENHNDDTKQLEKSDDSSAADSATETTLHDTDAMDSNNQDNIEIADSVNDDATQEPLVDSEQTNTSNATTEEFAQTETDIIDASQANTNSTTLQADKQQTPAQPYYAWQPWGQQGMFNPMAHNTYMSMMNPMFSMITPMMSMMGSMMNPAMMMNPMTVMNHPVNAMTQPQIMNLMMKSMDPTMMFSMFGQPSAAYKEGKVPDQLPVISIPGLPTQTYQNWPHNKVSPGISREAKKNAFQTAMTVSPLSMRDMISIMTDKLPVADDVSWDDAVEAMKLRANEVNFKFVGSSPLWKEIEAITEQPSAKVEIFRFCDAAVARKILDEIPEFIVFLPCKIALIEDGEGKLWVMTLDWDVSWLDFAQNPNSHLSKELRENATQIRESIAYIMEGAATGEF